MDEKEKCVEGNDKESSKIIKELIKKSDIQQKTVALKMGWTASSLSCRIKRGTLLADDFLKILEILGYKIKVFENQSGEEFETRKRGIGKRLNVMVNGVRYDTYKSDALCHTEERDGMFLELYKKDDGTYFVATYVNWEGGECSVSPINQIDAEKLYAKYAV